MRRILLDGNDFTSNSSGLESFKITLGLNNDNSYSFGSGTSFDFKGAAFEYIESVFFNGCNPFDTEIDVKIILNEERCNSTFDYKITYEDITYCPSDCLITSNIVEVTEEEKCHKQLTEKIFWKDNGFLESVDWVKIPYCEDEGFITTLLTIAFIVMFPLLFALELIETVLNAILSIINIIPFVGQLIPFGKINIPSLDDVANKILGCGYYHSAPLVKDIVEYNTGLCGAIFQSSILNSEPYNRMVLLCASSVDGNRKDELPQPKYKEENLPNLTTANVLDDLADEFNAEWRIRGNIIIFERRDYFDPARAILFSEADNTSEDVCYNFIQDNACAFGRFEYQKDLIDTQGNRNLNYYNDIVEWNSPPSKHQRGECTTQVNFSPAHFMHDQTGGGLRDDIRRGGSVFGAFLNAIPGINLPFNNQLLLGGGGRSDKCKLLILEPDYDPECALVIRKPRGDKWDYNYPLYFDENYDEPELYQRFHYINNPRTQHRKLYNSQSITVKFNCDMIEKLQTYKVDELGIYTRFGEGKPESIDLDFATCTLTANNIKIRCKRA